MRRKIHRACAQEEPPSQSLQQSADSKDMHMDGLDMDGLNVNSVDIQTRKGWKKRKSTRMRKKRNMWEDNGMKQDVMNGIVVNGNDNDTDNNDIEKNFKLLVFQETGENDNDSDNDSDNGSVRWLKVVAVWKWEVEVFFHNDNLHPCRLYWALKETDLYLTTHGFQSTALLFMKPGAVLFEVFPYKYWKVSATVPYSASRQILRLISLKRCMHSPWCRSFARGDDVMLDTSQVLAVIVTANEISTRSQALDPEYGHIDRVFTKLLTDPEEYNNQKVVQHCRLNLKVIYTSGDKEIQIQMNRQLIQKLRELVSIAIITNRNLRAQVNLQIKILTKSTFFFKFGFPTYQIACALESLETHLSLLSFKYGQLSHYTTFSHSILVDKSLFGSIFTIVVLFLYTI
eukprot:gene9242-19181_t